MNISVELLLLAMSGLFFVSLMAGKAGYRFGVPALLLFLSVGMLAGSDGLGIHFEDLHTSQAIGTVALLVYDRLGVAFLRTGWLNLDRVWTAALLACGAWLLFASGH